MRLSEPSVQVQCVHRLNSRLHDLMVVWSILLLSVNTDRVRFMSIRQLVCKLKSFGFIL